MSLSKLVLLLDIKVEKAFFVKKATIFWKETSTEIITMPFVLFTFLQRFHINVL